MWDGLGILSPPAPTLKNSIQRLQSFDPQPEGLIGLHCPHPRSPPWDQGVQSVPNNPCFSDLPEPCSYEDHVFQDGEDWPLSRCAKCVCRNGVVQCFTAQCQPLFCNQVRKTASEWILAGLLTSLFGDLGPPLRLSASEVESPREKTQRLFCCPYTSGDHH